MNFHNYLPLESISSGFLLLFSSYKRTLKIANQQNVFSDYINGVNFLVKSSSICVFLG